MTPDDDELTLLDRIQIAEGTVADYQWHHDRRGMLRALAELDQLRTLYRDINGTDPPTTYFTLGDPDGN